MRQKRIIARKPPSGPQGGRVFWGHPSACWSPRPIRREGFSANTPEEVEFAAIAKAVEAYEAQRCANSRESA